MKTLTYYHLDKKLTMLFCAGTCLLLVFLLSFYIIQINSFIKEKYLFSDYSALIKDLELQNHAMESSFAESLSLAGIEKRVRALGFVPNGKVEYIKMLETTVAAK